MSFQTQLFQYLQRERSGSSTSAVSISTTEGTNPDINPTTTMTQASIPRVVTRRGSNTHPSFYTKTMMKLNCVHCRSTLSVRSMKAILLADANIELYSTDSPPTNAVELVGNDYRTNKCLCKIRDIACRLCGNVIGYHVTQPCSGCLDACNNGHFWMFLSSCVTAMERIDSLTGRPLIWAQAHMLTEETDPDFCDFIQFGCKDMSGTETNERKPNTTKRNLLSEVDPCR